ncbi:MULTISPECIES: hypothetical protein [Streptomyces]|nr:MULTISPECIES: hypothetical protein [Streptomyces]MDI5905645.1 hypothetical protein [Streptomyces sp. 12257]
MLRLIRGLLRHRGGWCLDAAATVRHHRPAEVAVLLGAMLPHLLLGTW